MTNTHQPSEAIADDEQLGKYRLLATLGRGGMGTVYLALASGFGQFRKLLVVKELRRDVPWQSDSLGMFMDEAHLAARLDHPNVLHTFEACEDGGRYFLAMEYLDGQPLNTLIERGHESKELHGLTLPMQLHMLCEVLKGLQYAHELRDYDGSLLNVVHRDVSPHNVFVTYHGQVKIVDFGLAKASNASNLTSPGVFKGKLAYAAPEQLTGHTTAVDARCDVFSVGVMLWEAIANRRFSDGTATLAAIRLRTGGVEPRIRQIVPDVDPFLAEISDRALSVDPAQRYENAAAFRRDLDDYLDSKGQRVESAQIAEVMRELFRDERRERHRVIERAMGEISATRSTIQALPIDSSGLEQLRSKARVSVPPPSPAGVQPRAASAAGSVSGSRPVQVVQVKRSRGPSWGLLLAVAGAVFSTAFELSRVFTHAPAPTPRVVTVSETAPTPPSANVPPPVNVYALEPAQVNPKAPTPPTAARVRGRARPSKHARVEAPARTNDKPEPAHPNLDEVPVVRRAPAQHIDVEDPYQ
jgi:eukaryotic-like serine/threonine-protein kinase